MARRSRDGFTLIELLVSITIILILAAMLTPAFAQVRAKSKAAVCQSNLRQVGMALSQYMADWNDRLPTHWRVEEGHKGYEVWFFLHRYMNRDQRITACPSVPVRRFAYGYNWLYLDYTRIEDIANPTGTIAFADNSNPNNRPDDHPAHVFPPYIPWHDGVLPDPRHRGMANFLFVDGHVKLMAVSATVKPENLWDRL